jgi:hypothetical protein
MNKGMKIFLITLILGVTSIVFAQRVHFPAIGIGSGVILQQNHWHPGYSFELQCEVGEVMDYIFLTPYIAYWNAEKSESQSNITRTLYLNDINFGTEIIGYINPKPKGLFAGAGVGYHITMVDRLTAAYFNPIPEIKEVSETKLSFAALAGYQLKISAFSMGLKLKYYLINGGYNTLQTGLIFSYNF